MNEGIVFDIKEFAVNDGPGIRTTVFLKGCPLRCQWCHNPEGLSPRPQLMVSRSSCVHCGACEAVCKHKPSCIACGECVPYCRLGLRRIAGAKWRPGALAKRLAKDADVYRQTGGGVTFSGGEPLMQWDFVKETVRLMPGVHTAIETSGYATDEVFREAMATLDLILMDIKLIDAALHRKYTGADNAGILRHVEMLRRGNTPFLIRLPVIPGVNDNAGYYEGVAERLRGAKALLRVDILPYQRTAGAKYEMVGLPYRPDFDPARKVNIDTEPFERRNIPVKVYPA